MTRRPGPLIPIFDPIKRRGQPAARPSIGQSLTQEASSSIGISDTVDDVLVPPPELTAYGTSGCFAVEVGDLVIGVLNYRDDNVNISGSGYPSRAFCTTASYTQIDADYVWYDQAGNDARVTWKVWEITAAGDFGLQTTLPVSQTAAIRIKYTGGTIVQSNRVNLESSGVTSFSQSLSSAPSGLTLVVTCLAGNTAGSEPGSVSFAAGLTKIIDPSAAGSLTIAAAYGDAVQTADPSGWPAYWTTFGGYASRMWEIT